MHGKLKILMQESCSLQNILFQRKSFLFTRNITDATQSPILRALLNNQHKKKNYNYNLKWNY